MNSPEALQYPTSQQGHVMKKLLPPKGFSAPLSSNLIFFQPELRPEYWTVRNKNSPSVQPLRHTEVQS